MPPLPAPERHHHSEEPLCLTAHQLAVLHGLYDRPGAVASTTDELVRAATPYAMMIIPEYASAKALVHAAASLPTNLITRRKRRGTAWELAPGRTSARAISHGDFSRQLATIHRGDVVFRDPAPELAR